MNLPVLSSRPTCILCPLHITAKSVGVPGIWLPHSRPPALGTPVVIFLGRNPGVNENEQNQPFVGRSGNVLRHGYCGGPSPTLAELATLYAHNTTLCFTVADAEPNWKTNVKSCYPHVLTDLREILRCHANAGLQMPMIGGPSAPLPNVLPSCLASASPRAAVVCLGGQASQAFVALALGEPKPASQSECFKNNAREVRLFGHDIFLLHTYHPAYYLRKRSSGSAIQDHMELLKAWLQGNLVAPSSPQIVPPFPPN